MANINYKEYEIERFRGGYVVSFNGDDFFFESVDEAKSFIDEMTNFEF